MDKFEQFKILDEAGEILDKMLPSIKRGKLGRLWGLCIYLQNENLKLNYFIKKLHSDLKAKENDYERNSQSK